MATTADRVQFEMKVALLGHVSVGKTTVLNALFQDKYSEVSMNRTTAAINHFRISPIHNTDEETEARDNRGTQFRTAEETLAETSADNENLRDSNTQPSIKERSFDIRVNDTLCDMLPDTHLIIVDMPGVNEARTKNMYYEYVARVWDTFDAVIVVADGVVGANTSDNLELLEFVKSQLQKVKDIPVILLCNKVDDTQNEELMDLVSELRREVESLFQVGDREAALASMLGADATTLSLGERIEKWSPAFIPISAESAFLYRTVSQLDTDGLRSLPTRTLDKIGNDGVGSYHWRRLSTDERIQTVYDIVTDPEFYQDRLAASNFDKVLRALRQFLSGDYIQKQVLQKQLSMTLEKIRFTGLGQGSFIDSLSEIHHRATALRLETAIGRDVDDVYWTLMSQSTDAALKELHFSPLGVAALAKPMGELVRYATGLFRTMHGEAPHEKQERIIQEALKIIRGQMRIVVEKEQEWTLPAVNKKQNDNSGSLLSLQWVWLPDESKWKNSVTGDTRVQDTHPNGDEPKHWEWKDDLQKWRHVETFATRVLPSNQNPATFDGVAWEELSPRDWHVIVTSLLNLRCDANVCRLCSEDLMDLAWMQQFGQYTRLESCTTCVPSGRCACEHTLQYYNRAIQGRRLPCGDFSPVNPSLHRRVVHVSSTARISDPTHWAHVGWLFCQYLSSSPLPPPKEI